jgi:hypothetical protein
MSNEYTALDELRDLLASPAAWGGMRVRDQTYLLAQVLLEVASDSKESKDTVLGMIDTTPLR